jgi:hypothetical protein
MWDVVDKVTWFSVENQLVDRGQALVEEDGLVSQILEPETATWSLAAKRRWAASISR